MRSRNAAITGCAAEHFAVLLLVELTLYVTPCAMEMPTLLAALLHDAAAAATEYQDVTDSFFPPNIEEEISLPKSSSSIVNHNTGIVDVMGHIGGGGGGGAAAAAGISALSMHPLTTSGPSMQEEITLPEQKSKSKHFNEHPAPPLHGHQQKAMKFVRRCSIEITSKIPGMCQPMGPMNSACISGEYMDVFNEECL